MKRTIIVQTGIAVLLSVLVAGCNRGLTAKDVRLEDPPPADVERARDANLLQVAHPERFPLATAAPRAAAPELNVTGVVSADVSRNVPDTVLIEQSVHQTKVEQLLGFAFSLFVDFHATSQLASRSLRPDGADLPA